MDIEIPYNVEERKDTGLYKSKLGIWLFLASEIMLFGGREVAIIDFHKQPYGMVISSETLYKTVDGLFDFIWSVTH